MPFTDGNANPLVDLGTAVRMMWDLKEPEDNIRITITDMSDKDRTGPQRVVGPIDEDVKEVNILATTTRGADVCLKVLRETITCK